MSEFPRYTHDEPEEDPIAADRDDWVDPMETRTETQIAHDEQYAQEPYGNDAADEYWEGYSELYPEAGDVDISDLEVGTETENKFVLGLEAVISDRAAEQGLGEDAIDQLSQAVFTLKDEAGNPTDRLTVNINHYDGPLSRPGVDYFDLRPVDGEKDQWGRDAKFVRGSFSHKRFKGQDGVEVEPSFSMTFSGGTDVELREYAEAALEPEELAQADIELLTDK